MKNNMQTIAQLEQAGYKLHHTSRKRGYVSRKLEHGKPYPYKGKFGEGYCVDSPCFDSSQYCFVSYYVK